MSYVCNFSAGLLLLLRRSRANVLPLPDYSMFDYLRKEIFMLRTKNGELKQRVREVESEKRDILSTCDNTDSAASVSKLHVARLTKENGSLLSELIAHKNEATSLRKELKNINVSSEESVAAVTMGFEDMLALRDQEIRHMKKSAKKQHRQCKAEKDLLKAEIAKLEEAHTSDLLRLKDELRRTQDSHHDYLAKLMDVLETTHAARESETARISEELQSVKEEKDAHIMQLQREVEQLREMNRGQLSQMQSNLESKDEEISVMKSELERNTEARAQRAEKYQAVSAKLASTLRKSDIEPRQADKMRDMIHLMGNLYALEESSQAKINEDIYHTMDDFVVASEPSQVVADLKANVKALEMENLKLKYQVQEQNMCQRCERRDQRRREQQRMGEQQRQASRKSLSFSRRSSKTDSGQTSQPKPTER